MHAAASQKSHVLRNTPACYPLRVHSPLAVDVTDKQDSAEVARAASVELTSDLVIYQPNHTVSVSAAKAQGTAEGDVK